MAITWKDVTDLDPSLTVIPLPSQTMILRVVDLQVADRNWQELRDIGMTYLALHLATMVKRAMQGNGGNGPVTDQAAGGLSQSYAASDMITLAGNLGLTSYGVEYERLLRMTQASLGLVVGEFDCIG